VGWENRIGVVPLCLDMSKIYLDIAKIQGDIFDQRNDAEFLRRAARRK
jgi:hypothetical protein